MTEKIHATLKKVVSGGQTGVDRAALDAADACGLAVGGWVPAGRQTEDGTLDEKYPLEETPTEDPAQRTAWNVRDSDATLVLVPGGKAAGGTALAVEKAQAMERPLLIVQPDDDGFVKAAAWLAKHEVAVLNVAGPRESEAPGFDKIVRAFLERLFRALLHREVQ